MNIEDNNGFVKLEDIMDFDKDHRYLIKVEPYSSLLYQQQRKSILDYYSNINNEFGEKEIDLFDLDIIQDSPEFEANIFQIYYSKKHLDTNGNKLQYVKFINIDNTKNLPNDFLVLNVDDREIEAPLSQVWIKDLTEEANQLASEVARGTTIGNEVISMLEENMFKDDEVEEGDEQYYTNLKKEQEEERRRKATMLPTLSPGVLSAFSSRSSGILSKRNTTTSNRQIVVKKSDLPTTFKKSKGGKKVTRKKGRKKDRKISRRKSNKRITRKNK